MPKNHQNPRENPDLTGHEAAEKLVMDAISGGNIPHSWLITGVRGIGKATLAYRFARYLLSGAANTPAQEQENSLFGDALPPVSPQNLHIPPDNPIFSRIAQGSHPDLKVLEVNREEGRNEITVDEVRAVEHFISHTTAESDWRIVIIDSADDMNRNAANALLKVLEEPPHNVIILLVNHNPGRLLPTIRSRCRFLRLKPLAQEDVFAVLAKIAPKLADNEAEFAAALSEGSPGQAAELYEVGGLEIYQELVGILAELPNPNIARLQKLGDKIAKKDAAAQWRLLTYMFSYFIAKTVESGVQGGQGGQVGESGKTFAEGESEVRQYLLANYSTDRLIDIWEETGRIVSQTDGFNMDKKLTTINMFGKLVG